MRISRNKTVRVLLLGCLFVLAASFSRGIRAQDVAPKVAQPRSRDRQNAQRTSGVSRIRTSPERERADRRSRSGLVKCAGMENEIALDTRREN